MATPRYDVVSPLGDANDAKESVRQAASAAALTDLKGKRLGLCWTAFTNGDIVLRAFQEHLGKLKYFSKPPIIVYDPSSYKVKGADVRELLGVLQPGDAGTEADVAPGIPHRVGHGVHEGADAALREPEARRCLLLHVQLAGAIG